MLRHRVGYRTMRNSMKNRKYQPTQIGPKKFEYKKMTYAWRKEKEDLIKIKMSKRTINCTPEHKILTINGYIEANKLKLGDLIISKYDKNINYNSPSGKFLVNRIFDKVS